MQFTRSQIANLISDTLLAPLAIAVSPPDNTLLFSTQQWEIAKATLRTVVAYLAKGGNSSVIDSVLINCNKAKKKYDLHTLSKINLESLFNNSRELLEQLSLILPSLLEKSINNGNFDLYFEEIKYKE